MKERAITEVKSMRAVVTNPYATPRLMLNEVPLPVPALNQAVIKVVAFSLNQGEVRTALDAIESYTPGWDFAGVVEKAAEDGSTPKAGTRVFGYVPSASWSEYLVTPGGLMAEIPEEVSSAEAATLPIAGVTALACLEASGDLLNRKVLITGAAGGVGRFACQLAALAGAKVYVISRRPHLLQQLQQDGVKSAGLFTSVTEAKSAGTYDVIWDSLGGESMAAALTALSRNGICVNYGNSSRQPTTFEVRTSSWPIHTVQCVWLGREPIFDSTPIFNKLVGMVQQGQLHIPIDRVLPWTSVAAAAEELLQQHVHGKIVLEVR